MAKDASGANVMLGKGKVYFNRLDSSGVPMGERFLGNCTVLEVTTTDELREIYSSAEQSSPLLKSVNVRRTQEFSLTMSEFTKENMALALMGDNSALAQGSGSLAATIEIPQVYQGYYYDLTHRNVTAATVVVKNSTEVTTYVLGTDYDEDAVSGRIYIIPGGGISDGDEIHVTAYNYTADTSTTVRSGVDNTIEGSLRFIGDPATGPIWELEVWSVSMTPEGALGFISDDYAEFTLKGKVQADSTNHPTEPYFRLIKRAA